MAPAGVSSRRGTSPLKKALGKLQAEAQQAIDEQIKAVRSRPQQDRKSLAVELLVQGKAQAFVDFFLLTHGRNAIAATVSPDGAAAAEEIELPLESLLFLHQHTVQAHDAMKAGQPLQAYDAYKQLGSYYSRLGQVDRAAVFYEKSLQVCGCCGRRWACTPMHQHTPTPWLACLQLLRVKANHKSVQLMQWWDQKGPWLQRILGSVMQVKA